MKLPTYYQSEKEAVIKSVLTKTSLGKRVSTKILPVSKKIKVNNPKIILQNRNKRNCLTHVLRSQLSKQPKSPNGSQIKENYKLNCLTSIDVKVSVKILANQILEYSKKNYQVAFIPEM